MVGEKRGDPSIIIDAIAPIINQDDGLAVAGDCFLIANHVLHWVM